MPLLDLSLLKRKGISPYLDIFSFIHVLPERRTRMAVSEKSAGRGLLSTNIWAVGVRQIVYMALGAALYGGLSWATNALQLPSAGNVSLRPAIVIPLFFGAVFGPWVGLFTGGIGNLLGDYVSGYGVFWNWDVGNALIGFIAGLTLLRTAGRYTSTRNIIIAEVFSAVAIIVGIGFASYTEIWLSKLSFISATVGYLVPAALSDLINGLILLPILLIAYNAARARSGRG
jgi:energy-coupling factor transport system substrate-specific component